MGTAGSPLSSAAHRDPLVLLDKNTPEVGAHDELASVYLDPVRAEVRQFPGDVLERLTGIRGLEDVAGDVLVAVQVGAGRHPLAIRVATEGDVHGLGVLGVDG
jgi:hypothetical protein